MEYLRSSIGLNGTISLYEFAVRFFTIFGIASFPLCTLFEAPFGRVNFSGGFSINGTVGWLIMESVSPIAFLIVMNSRIGPIFNFADFNSLPSLSSISFLHFLHPLTQMPPARAVLSSLFLLHYLHRAMISSFTNPGRSKMNISVPLSAIWFNWLNGSMMGTFLTNYSSKQENFGLKEGKEWIFVLGVTMFLIGMAGNIYSDSVLYKGRTSSTKSVTQAKNTKSKYFVPTGFLYDYPFGGITFPNYSTEWFEWMGLLLASTTLTLSGYSFIDDSSWYQKPPALFLINLVGVMLPRAISGKRWYIERFPDFPKERWVVLPGLI